MFRISPSPFVLEQRKQDERQTIMELKQSMYVDDVTGGRENIKA